MNLIQLSLFALTEALFSASPGPAVFMVISASMKSGLKAAVAATGGILLGNLTYFTISSFILVFSLTVNEFIFDALRWFGVVYIIYLLWDQYKNKIFPSKNEEVEKAHIEYSKVEKKTSSYFIMAYIMQIANPKTIVFFTSFLPQFIDKDGDLVSQFSLLAAISITVEFVVLMMYAKVSSALISRLKNDKITGYLEGVGNVTMVFAVVWGIALSK